MKRKPKQQSMFDPIPRKAVETVGIENQMKECYIDYAMSVITDRALPDVRDGLKPVQRRILYAMYDLGITPDKPFRKSARIVGEVLGKYHPHGDTAVYDAMVRMAQDFSLRYPLVWGQGNFGSMDGDGAAAMRYTEAKLRGIAGSMLADIGKNTVDFRPNFDGSESEPVLLPAQFPNLIVNGSSGIAVGMACNIPPHNLGEAIDATLMVLNNPDASVDDILTVMPGPDFPTAGIINGAEAIREAYETGKGKLKVRCRMKREAGNRGKTDLVITEVPYMTNKAKTVEKIAAVAKERKVGQGIADVRDESGRNGIRIVVEVKKGYDPKVIEDALYKYTDLETTFGYNMLALVDGVPRQLGIVQYLKHYLVFKHETTGRRLAFDLQKLRDRIEILEALVKILDQIDLAIRIIRQSKNTAEARKNLMDAFELNERQAQAVLDMRLQKLTNMEMEKTKKELAQARKEAARIEGILKSKRKMDNLIKKELAAVKDQYGDKRRTVIRKREAAVVDIQKAVQKDVRVEITYHGYIDACDPRKKTGINTVRSDDFITDQFIANTGDYLLAFTNTGQICKRLVEDMGIADGGNRKASHIGSYFSGFAGPLVSAFSQPEKGGKGIVMVTSGGLVKRMPWEELKAISRPCVSGIRLKKEDEVIAVLPYEDKNLVLVSSDGYGLMFPAKSLRNMKKQAAGVTGMKLADSRLIGAFYLETEARYLEVITEEGYVKEIPVSRLKPQNRAGKGLILIKVNGKTGKVYSVGLDGSWFVKADKPIEVDNKTLAATHRGYNGKPMVEGGTVVVPVKRMEDLS